MIYARKYKDCLSYIDSYWDKIIVKPKKFHLGWGKFMRGEMGKKPKKLWDTPHAFITPNDQKFKYIYYWDTFFLFKGLIGTKREWVLKEMVDNFIFLFEKFGIIPNFNSPAASGRSQPPFLTSMILDTYNGPYYRYLNSNRIKRYFKEVRSMKMWLKRTTEVAIKEYWDVWEDKDSYYHKVPEFNLNRYGDRDIGYAHSSELESGWDFTSRFYNRCNEFLPVDLNIYLYKYEKDFSKIFKHLGNTEEINKWDKISKTRMKRINKYLWNGNEGFFFDYNYKHEKMSDFLSLAGFTPLWAELATKEQAEKMVKKLKYFETNAGLVITAKKSLAPKVDLTNIPERYRFAVEDVLRPKQWDYPYIWPPLEYLTVIGLLKYGFIEDAKRIMDKSLKAQANIYEKYGTFFEKTNALSKDINENFHYNNQSGFGWTNAVFYRYVQILDSLDRGERFSEIPEILINSDKTRRFDSIILNKFTRKKI